MSSMPSTYPVPDFNRDIADRFRLLFNTMAQGVVYHDCDGHIIEVNPAAERILGLSREQLTGNAKIDPRWHTINEDGSDLPASEHPAMVAQRTGREVRDRTLGICLPDSGTCRWVVVSAVPEFLPGHSRPFRSYATITDVTEYRQALSESLRFKAIFNTMAEGVALHSLIYAEERAVNYRIDDVNPSFERILGIPRARAVGRLAGEVYGTGEHVPYLEEYARVSATGTPYTFETFFPPLNKHFLISVTSFAPRSFVTIFFDITGQKQAEELIQRQVRELEERNGEMESFTYTVSHDLRSPLVTIKGFAELARDALVRADSKQAQECVARIEESTTRMSEMLKDLLELSRVGRLANPATVFSPAEVAREAFAFIEGVLTPRGATVTIAPAIPDVCADRQRIREIFQNLIENGAKFARHGVPPTIAITGERTGTMVTCRVRDNGIGIDPDMHERIFRLFTKLDQSTQGTGVGLAIVKRIVELYGGTISVSSSPGEGSEFVFTIPAAQDAHPQ